jgi:hypothetical protein
MGSHWENRRRAMGEAKVERKKEIKAHFLKVDALLNYSLMKPVLSEGWDSKVAKFHLPRVS